MGPPTCATLIRPDQPLQWLGPYLGVWTPNGPSTLISPDQPLQKEEQGTLSEVSWS